MSVRQLIESNLSAAQIVAEQFGATKEGLGVGQWWVLPDGEPLEVTSGLGHGNVLIQNREKFGIDDLSALMSRGEGDQIFGAAFQNGAIRAIVGPEEVSISGRPEDIK